MARDRVAGRWRRLGIAAAVLLGSLGAVAAFRLGAGRTPAARTWIVVADAENATRDSVFDRSLTVALGAALAESPTVDVLPTARVREVSRRMRRPDGAPLDEAAAIEVAQRVGAGAVVVPSVARVGGRVMLSARLVAASPREYPDAPAAAPRPALASARAEAGGDTDVLPALDRLARQLRRALGESYLAVHGAVPLPLATTASLPALKAYAEGNRAYDAGRAGDAVNAWHLALAYDSTFALVHTQLGAHLAWINQPAEAETHFVQALRHAERLPPRERLLVEAGVATWRGDRQRAIALEEGWLVDHPNDRGVLGRLAYAYLRARRFADARDAYDRLLRVDSLDATSQINLATALSALGTPADLRRAQSAYARAFALDSVLARDVDLLHEYAQMLVASGRPDSAAGVFRAMLGREPTARARGQRGLAFLALARGRPGEAAAAFREAVRIHHAISDNVLSELRVRLFRAAALDESGAPAAAAAERDTALGLALARPIEPAMLVHVGRALTRGGRVADARVVRDSLRARVRPGSQPDSAALLLLDAELAVAAGRAEEGERFAAAAYRVEPSASALETLARAAWRRGDLAGAAARYTQLAALSKFGSEEAEGPRRALYWLGLVEEARGDHAAARRAWGAFVARFPEPGSDGITLADARWRLAAR
jgi:tetratricopeptide (TPR) repeat protein